jgi:hypothetical protein
MGGHISARRTGYSGSDTFFLSRHYGAQYSRSAICRKDRSSVWCIGREADHDQALLDETKRAYASILGSEGSADGDEISFHAGRVCDIEGLGDGARIVLRLPKDDKEGEAAKKTGFWYGEVVLVAKATAKKSSGERERLDGGDEDVRGLWVEYV